MSPGAVLLPFNALEHMSADDVQGLLGSARRLRAGSGPALKGRHVAVLSEEPAAAPSADAVAGAAVALGATVVWLRPSTLALDETQRLRETARLLGRLYQLIAGDGLDPGVVAGLSRWAGVPLLIDVMAPSHPSRRLAEMLSAQERDEGAAPRAPSAANPHADAHRRVLQALLLNIAT